MALLRNAICRGGLTQKLQAGGAVASWRRSVGDARPPCPPCSPAAPLTCHQHLSLKNAKTKTNKSYTLDQEIKKCGRGCDSDRDNVARRLSHAEQARRLHYEQEVATYKQVEHKIAQPLALYRIGSERECAPATDGKEYAILSPSSTGKVPKQRCGSDRTPPPPRCVELIPDGECQIHDKEHLDPCAHRPRILLDIDRSTKSPRSTAQSPKGNEQTSPPPKKLASRIMESLKRNTTGTCSPKRHYKPECDKRASNTEWCKNVPKPVSPPLPCREPTLVERLRSRGAPRCKNTERPHGKRYLHTSSNLKSDQCSKGMGSNTNINTITSQINSDFKKLNTVLSNKKQLKEAGQGRVVRSNECNQVHKSPRIVAAGQLDIPIQVGISNVRVHESFQNVSINPIIQQNSKEILPRATSVPCLLNNISKIGKSDSWLSIKNIQKKLAACRKTEESKSNKRQPAPVCPPQKTKTPKTPPSPCKPQTPSPKEKCPHLLQPFKFPQEPKRFSSIHSSEWITLL